MSLNVYKFRSQLKDGGARPNLFRVIMNFPSWVSGPTEQASFLVKTAQFPASTVGKIEVPFRGRQIPYPGDRTYEDWTVRVINGTDFAVRDAMIKWHNGINGLSTNIGIIPPDDVIADMKVQQLDKQERVIKSVDIRGAFPLTVGSIDLSFDTTNSVEEFDLTFAYLLWEPGKEGGNILSRVRSTIQSVTGLNI